MVVVILILLWTQSKVFLYPHSLPCDFRAPLIRGWSLFPKPWISTNLVIAFTNESESEVAQSCLTLCDPVDCSLPASSIHGILQAIILEWVAISFSKGSSWPRDQTRGLLHCRQTLYPLSHQGRLLPIGCSISSSIHFLSLFKWSFRNLAFLLEPFCCSGSKSVAWVRDHMEKSWVRPAVLRHVRLPNRDQQSHQTVHRDVCEPHWALLQWSEMPSWSTDLCLKIIAIICHWHFLIVLQCYAGSR